jgi:hypothetical protein
MFSEVILVVFVLAGLFTIRNMKYETALQLFNLETDHSHIFTLQDIEKKILALDEKI